MSRRVTLAAIADIVCVLAFVAVGRRNHEEDGSLLGVLGVAAPFLVALALGWVVLRAWRSPVSPITGAGLAVVTVVVGMLLRRTVWDGGTATSFVIVATVATAVLLIGWRAAASGVRSLRSGS